MPIPRCARRYYPNSNKEAGFQQFRTSSQNFYGYDVKALAVGESNQGIVSEKSKWIHTMQMK